MAELEATLTKDKITKDPHILSIVASNPEWAYRYAARAIKGRWPEAETTLAKDPLRAYYYALYVIKGRWPEAEEATAKSEYKDRYLQHFPDAKDDWAMNGWIDWLD